MIQTSSEGLRQEIQRLYEKLHTLGWAVEDCAYIVPTTLENNQLKKSTEYHDSRAFLPIPEIMYGVGNFIGDS